VLTLGLGLGAATAIFALVHTILIQPLPYTDADRLVAIKHAAPGLGLEETGLSSGTFFHYRAHAESLETIAVYDEDVETLSGGGEAAESIRIARVGPDFFRVLDVRPVLGRMFTEEDGRNGFMNTTWTIPVLLSHALWQRRYGADPDVVGVVITIGDSPREVVGVLPSGFALPSPDTDIWTLFLPPGVTANFARSLDYEAIGRLRVGTTPTAAEAELARLLPSIEGAYRDATPARMEEVKLTPVVAPLKDEVLGGAGAVLWPQLGGVGFLMLVVFANVATLFLVRGDHRGHEVAVRRALGAGSADLMRLFSSEATLLAAAGAVLALLLANWGLSALVAFAPVELPRLHEVRLDAWAIGFTALVAAGAALVFTLCSVLWRSRPGLAAVLKGGGTAATAGRGRRMEHRGLVVVQVALALVLLVGSALMVQSFRRLLRVDPGFDAEGLLTVETGLVWRSERGPKQAYDPLLERIRALPAVRDAAAASAVPFAGGRLSYPLRVVDRETRPGETEPIVEFKFFTPGYFQVMGIPVVDGMGFARQDRSTEPHPVIVSATLARRLFPGENAIGKKIRRLSPDGSEVEMFDRASGQARAVPPFTIVGVAGDVREESLRAGPGGTVYVPLLEPAVEMSIVPTRMTLVVRTNGAPLSLARTVRELVAELDPTMSVARVRTMDAIVASSVARERFLAVLLLIATTASLFLGAVGIWGVVAHAVQRRTREIGVRVALGAQRSQVLGAILRESVGIVFIGVALGLATAAAVTRTLRPLLFEMSPTDPATLGTATALIVGTALLASWLPARRATRVDPVISLRDG
jgi:predicted permease